jgi:hypothetical protein
MTIDPLRSSLSPTPLETSLPLETPREPKLDNPSAPLRGFEGMWNEFFKFFVQIPGISHLVLGIWRFGIWAIKPSTFFNSAQSLFFSSTLEIPPWFSETMRRDAAETLISYFQEEFEVLKEKPPTEESLSKLSQMGICKELYQHPDLTCSLENQLQKLLTKWLKTIPIIKGSPCSKAPFSPLFLKALALTVKTENLESLTLHGSFKTQEDRHRFFTQLDKACSLTTLELGLDCVECVRDVEEIGMFLNTHLFLKTLVLKLDPSSHEIPTLSIGDWKKLTDPISAHCRLQTLRLENFPLPASQQIKNYSRGQIEGNVTIYTLSLV